MNIKLLEVFLAVIDNETMSAAANRLFTTQPNISLMIKDLENYYSQKSELSERLFSLIHTLITHSLNSARTMLKRRRRHTICHILVSS